VFIPSAAGAWPPDRQPLCAQQLRSRRRGADAHVAQVADKSRGEADVLDDVEVRVPAVQNEVTPGMQRPLPADSPGRAADLDALLANYRRNLAALYRRDAALARALEATAFGALPALERARDGAWTTRIPADDGAPVHVHSRHAPADEARRLAAPAATAENPTFVIQGMGLGYLAVELERVCTRPLLVAAEPNLALLKLALCVHDLSAPLDAGRLILLTSADKRSVHDRLIPANANLLLGTQFITHPYTQRCDAAFHAQLGRLLADFVAYCRLQLVTLIKNARITARNIALNLPSYLAAQDVADWAGRLRGYPAVVVAAGPSLAGALDLLPGLRERAAIIAVQTVFRLLLARGCRPHFVTSLDFHELSAHFFAGLADVGDCTLVAEPKATWHVFDRYPGRRCILHSPLADDLLREAAPARGGLRPGSTVAHLAFYLAEHLGCDPIILVGQDLCYVDGLYYPPGLPIDEVWRPELGRFCTLETKQWERIVRSRPILRRVADVHGRPTYTDDQLFNYAEQFQADFQACPARVIHAGMAGMRLANATPMPLADAAAQFCTRPLPAGWSRPPRPAVPAASRERAREALRARRGEVAAIADIGRRMLALLEQLMQLVEQPAEFNRRLVAVDELRTEIRRFDRTYRTVVGIAPLAELRRIAVDRRLQGDGPETPATARARLKRDRDFVAALIEGCTFLEELLPQAEDRLAGDDA
jgi:hypothetical protein